MRLFSLIFTFAAFGAVACSAPRNDVNGGGGEKPSAEQLVPVVATPVRGGEVVRGGRPNYALPRTVIYKTNGNYDDNVAIRLNPDGSLLTFPGPGDVGEQSVPLRLADGWLLDRRGAVGSGTVFLKYTYREYHALAEPPSTAALKTAIIPGAHVTEAYALPRSVQRTDTAAINALIREGLPGATRFIP